MKPPIGKCLRRFHRGVVAGWWCAAYPFSEHRCCASKCALAGTAHDEMWNRRRPPAKAGKKGG